MESPPSSTTWSEAFILSDDSGLLLTNSSISSGSMSDSKSGPNRYQTEDSDCEGRSLSQDSLDMMCGENFNTLKKGPNWMDYPSKQASPIEPPIEFQDRPPLSLLGEFCDYLAAAILNRALEEYRVAELRRIRILHNLHHSSHHHLLTRSYCTPEFMSFSPCHGRPSSRSSLGSSRLSSSHNSLSVPAAHRVDDSSFITQAVSHDTLSSNQISDLYTVPFDSDMYAVPVDVIKPPTKPRRTQQNRKKRRNTASECREIQARQYKILSSKKNTLKLERYHWGLRKENKRHSVAGTSAPLEGEPIHMTLQEVRRYLQTLYSSSSDSSEHKEKPPRPKPSPAAAENRYASAISNLHANNASKEMIYPAANAANGRTKKNAFLISIKNKKVKDSCENVSKQVNNKPPDKRRKTTPAKFLSFKQTLCNMFRFKRFVSPEHVKCDVSDDPQVKSSCIAEETHNNISCRALPPLPSKEEETSEEEQNLDFATSIQRVKDYGWYWGPLPSEVAEKILSNEPDGSFIVRDSSDDHYIFSLTFKLNNCVRHVRIDHDQGNFSFGSCTKFKSQTIVEFIENAVEHSRSGRYLFFLHRRPLIGPVRVQLLHPVSRFKQVQSLQHICRFAIHKVVRRDLIPSLPLPRRMIDYLNTPHYYSEHLIDVEDTTNEQVPPRTPTPAIQQDYQENDIQDSTAPNMPINNYIVLNNNNNPRQS